MAQTICGPLPLITALGVAVLPTSKTQNAHIEHYIPQDPKAWPSHSVSNHPGFVPLSLLTRAVVYL